MRHLQMTLPLAMVSVALVGGCASFSDDEGVFVDRSDDYIDAREGPELLIPDDLSVDLEDPFPIPQIPVQLNSSYYPGRPPLPDAIYANDNRDEIRIQRLGTRSWLVVPEPPTTVWPKVKQFLAENGVDVTHEVPGQGRITTEWLVVTDEEYRDVIRVLLQDARSEASLSTGSDRLLLRVEQGLRQFTSEVHVRHANDSLGVPPDPLMDLTLSSSDLESAERSMLRELGSYIAARVAEHTESMVAQEIASQAKAVLERDSAGDPILRLYLDEERAWATLGQSLNNADVDVIDENRDAGTYYVNITDSVLTGEEEPGFFARLFTFGGDDGLDLMIQLSRESEHEHVLTVRDAEGHAIQPELSQQVLVLIREFAA